MGKNFIIEQSFQLIRTNPKLTSNIKICIDNEYKLYLESFNSNKQLSDDKYKHYQITKDSFFEDKIPEFYDGLPANLAFDVKDNDDKNIMYKNYSDQFDNIYFSGAKKIEDNQFFKEEFEYLAPLYIKKGSIPSNFIILRVDDLGVYEKNSLDYNLSSTNKDNFRNEIINKWKCVKVYDMSYKTDFGYWLDINYLKNDRFPLSPLEIDFKKDNYTKFNGIDYSTGIYTNKSMYLNDKFYFEQPHFRMEEFLTDSYRSNELLYPNIANFKFLFDDTPATPFELNKYSINRYFGFYSQSLTLVKTITPYKQQVLKNSVTLNKEGFFSECPFNIWDNTKQYYVYAKNDLRQVIKTDDGKYKMISNVDITISDIVNDYEVDIIFNNTGLTYNNEIKPRNELNFSIDTYINSDGIHEMDADLYLIKINDIYHVLESETDVDGFITYRIRTDYGINCGTDELKYWIYDINSISGNTSEYGKILLVDDNKNKPLTFEIYKVKFSDIKDFDFDRVNTHFSDNELDNTKNYNESPEQKFYVTDYLNNDVNSEYKEYPQGHKYDNKKVIVSSEYISSDELYEIKNNNLTDIWKKNQCIVKWGFMGSNSNSDYPYKLNNSNKVGFEYNRTTNTSLSYPNVINKTNDYFYRIGNILSGDTILHYDVQTLSIETDSKTYKNEDYGKFNLDTYILSNIDYFDNFFKNNRYNNSGKIEQTTKFSMIVNGTNYNSSCTLFKGIKYNIRKIKDVVMKNGYADSVTLDKTSNYNDYKFSIIFNINDTINGSNIIDNKGTLDSKNEIHLFLNDKYKNILIIINAKLSMPESFVDLETMYDKNMNPELYTASNFINSLNNINMPSFSDGTYISYHYIDLNGVYGRTRNDKPISNSTISNTIWGKDFPPFMIDAETSDLLSTKRQSYKKAIIKGPKYNIYDKYKKDYFEIPYDKSFIKDPLAMKIDINETPILPKAQRYGENLEYVNKIYRYSGPYEPIFKDIELFENYKYNFFDTNVFNIETYAQNVDEIIVDDSENWSFRNKIIGKNDNNYCISDFGGFAKQSIQTNYLYVSNFGFALPKSAKITNVKINIKKKAHLKNKFNFILDKNIQMILNNDINNVIGPNLANVGYEELNTNIPNVNYLTSDWNDISGYTWNTGNTSSETTSEYNLDVNIGSILLTVDELNSPEFGLIIQAKKFSIFSNYFNTAYIDYVSMTVYYTMESIKDGQSYFFNVERNHKFDTSLEKFGIIEEFQFSKVNENENLLKIKNNEEDKSIYPMIDEYGLQYDKRFIFKSSWDTDFCVRTKNIIKDKNER